MKRVSIKLALAAAAVGALGIGAVAMASDGQEVRETLTGYEEFPALSTPGVGVFEASVNQSTQEIFYRLRFSDLESDVTQAHIHFENETNSGPIVVFLCSNLGNGPVGTQACPAANASIQGTITAVDVGDGAVAQGLAAGEFDELVDAIRAGATYVNVHSVDRPSGEVRAQLSDDEHSHE